MAEKESSENTGRSQAEGPEGEDQGKAQEQQAEPEKRRGRASAAPVDFVTFLSGLAGQVLISLGQVESPITKKREPDMQRAKQTIDLLQVLKAKTKGNLTEEERKYLDGLLYDLRMRYLAANR